MLSKAVVSLEMSQPPPYCQKITTYIGWTMQAYSKCTTSYIKQESCRAITKMTARCAICMGALEIFGSPWQGLTIRPRLLLPNVFCSDGPYYCSGQIWSL